MLDYPDFDPYYFSFDEAKKPFTYNREDIENERL